MLKIVLCNNKVAVLKARGKRALVDVNVHCKMTSVITLDGVILERLYKYMSTVQLLQDFFSAMVESWKKLKTSMCFRRLLHVRIEIDQL